MKMMAYVLLLGEIVLSGCATGGRSVVTLEDELTLAFGSYSNACEATMQIFPAFIMVRGFPVELSREHGVYVLENLRRCTRYVNDAEISVAGSDEVNEEIVLEGEDVLECADATEGENVTECADATEGEKVSESHVLHCCPTAMELRMTKEENRFSIYFTANGILYDYLCPTPDSVIRVNSVLNCCTEECCKAYELLNSEKERRIVK